MNIWQAHPAQSGHDRFQRGLSELEQAEADPVRSASCVSA